MLRPWARGSFAPYSKGVARSVVPRRHLRFKPWRRALATLALALPAVAVAAGGPVQAVVTGQAALVPSPLASLIPSPLASLVPSPVASAIPSVPALPASPLPLPTPLDQCVTLPPPLNQACTNNPLATLNNVVAPTSAPGGGGPGAGSGGGGSGSGGGTGSVGAGNATILLSSAPLVPPGSASGLGAGATAPPQEFAPDAFATLLASLMKDGLGVSSDHVWPFLAAAQGLLLVALAAWFGVRAARRRPAAG